MLEELFGNLDSFDGIDTSDVDAFDDGVTTNDDTMDMDSDDIQEDTTSFYDTFMNSDDVDIDSGIDFNGFIDTSSDSVDVMDDGEQHMHYHPARDSQISFTGGTHCMEYHCGCRSFEGTFGTVCTNCGHGYDKHF